jgi:hypothetical protein
VYKSATSLIALLNSGDIVDSDDHAAVVAEVAVSICPVVGGAAVETVTDVPVVLSELAATVLEVSVMVLLVSVSVVVLVIMVSVISGKVRVLLVVCDEVKVVVVLAVPSALKLILIVGSVRSVMNVVVSTRVAAGLDHAAVVADVATKDWPKVGGAAVDTVTDAPVVLSELVAMLFVASVIVLLVRMSVVVLVMRVSVVSGRVRMRLAVCDDVSVVVVAAVPAALNPIRIVGVTESTMKVVVSMRAAAGLDHAAVVAEVATKD